MGVNISRFYKREQWKLDCEIITPMFLGNADQEAELRTAPFKALLRYWWRVANGAKFQPGDHKALLAEENKIFGSSDEKTGGKSRVMVAVTPISPLSPLKNNFKSPGKIDHPECEKANNKTEPLNYLAGMGLIHFKNGIQHGYFDTGDRFQLKIEAAQQTTKDVQSALHLLGVFGAIGSRSRNGWGCFSSTKLMGVTKIPLLTFSKAFDRDYPHCLGKDDRGALFWQTRTAHSTWEQCMKELAIIYVSLRAGNIKKNIPKLEVNSGSPPARHLLGYPVTNHSVKRPGWGNQGRHGSALRLLVRKEAAGHRGYILHLPHLFSEKMWPNGKSQQIKIWQQVHRSLDELCDRSSFQEVN